MEDCIFCRIVKGEIPSKPIYEDDRVYAFYDINPAAPIHFLVIPKKHTASCAGDINESNSDDIAYIFETIAKITREKDIKSYRIVNNCGKEAGQTVFHLHFHVLAGRELSAMG